VAATSSGNPYKQIKLLSYKLRYFQNKNPRDLFWHRDTEDRWVWKIFGNVKIQMDNELPNDLKMFNNTHIPKNTFHRVIANRPFLILIKGE
jgi:hypothetical protein